MKLQDVPLRCIFLQLLVAAANSQDLPYNPTSIFLSDKNAATKDIAYIFLPTASNSQHYLAALNVSSTLSATNLSLETITATLPFLSDDSIAFIPSISSTGEIAVYAGSCATSTSSALWRFTPSNTSASGNGTWARERTSTASRVTSTDLPGADFLSQGFTFSTLVSANASQTGIYIFGGMCPTNSSTASTWQSAASYSNHMLRLSPESTSGSITSYTLDLPTSSGPPIPEAGFTITGLTPTYSNGSGVMTQSQNFILLGGHTETAFINMSQVAIWSLPEDTWSFVTIDSPSSDSANTELTVKSTAKRTVTSIDSRSGHTAVLSEDGARIIVFGGWVGDVSQAADPQLAVLELGTGFGGSGDWIWSVPEKQPPGPGIYGHGAAMLPGNVMMVLGGYNVSTSSSKRAETSSGTSNPSFFNATSMSWISDYANPAYVAAIASQASSSPASRTYAKKVGLGAGLGLGFAAIIAAIAIYCWYSKRLKRKRLAEREKDIRALGFGTADYYSYYPNRDMGARGGGMFPWANGRWNGNDRDEHVYDSTSGVAGYENLNTGVHALGDNENIQTPSNRQIPRKPLNSRNATRGLYQATPTFDPAPGHTRSNSLGTAGPIHPIYEADEDLDHPGQHASGGVGVALGDPADPTPAEPNQKKVYRFSDPFKDPPTTNFSGSVRNSNRSTTTPSPESSAREREKEVSEWISDWDAADALLHQQTKYHSTAGRLSPTKRAQLIAARDAGYNSEDDSGRTTSNISEHSIAVSALTVSRSGSSSQGRSRSDSLRGFINTAIHPFSSTAGSNTVLSETFDRTGPSDPRTYPVPSSAGSGTTSFNTAPTSFIELQAQAESLLPRPDDHVTSPDDSPTRAYPESPTRDYYIEPSGSPSKNKGLLLGRSRTQGGWLGSLRRVFAGESGSNRTGYAEPFSTHNFSADRSSAGLDPVIGAAGVEPRRTVSAGATLWRRKQGKVDWQDSAEAFDTKPLANARRSATITGNTGPPHFYLPGVESSTRTSTDDDEWDIEKAVERRVVQVMFTVPKEKLRVVNHDVIEDLSDVASLKSRQGSQKEKEAEAEAEGSENAIGVQIPEAPRDNKGKGKEVDRPKSKVLEMVESFEAKSRPNSPARSVTPGR